MERQKKVNLLNTFYAFEQESQVKSKQNDGSTKEVKCPICMRGFITFIGGIDLCDQCRKVLSCSRKSTKWYMRWVCFLLMFVLSMNLFWRKRVKLSETNTKTVQDRPSKPAYIFSCCKEIKL